MSIRPLTQTDLFRMTDICIRGMEYENFPPGLIAEKTLAAADYDPDLSLGYELDGRLVGFAQGAFGRIIDDKQMVCVRLMAVDRAVRRQKIGTALLTEMESRVRARGGHVLTMFDSSRNYLTPGVDFRYTEAYCFLQKHGYTMHRENHNLICNLHPDLWPDLDAQAAVLAAEGIEIRRARRDESSEILAFINENWPPWRFEVEESLANTPEALHIALKDGKPVAFSGYQGNNKALPWFGPMGTTETLRGKGVGGILLRLCLRDLALQGWNHAIIPWVGPIPFYARFCKARIHRCFWAWRKDL